MESSIHSSQSCDSFVKAHHEINAELKRLLVASVGNDLEKEIEDLLREKVSLSQTVSEQREQLNHLSENLDGLNIQADMWHCKYQASKVIVDELSAWKAHTLLRVQEICNGMDSLLSERTLLWDSILSSHSTMDHLRQRLDKSSQSHTLPRICDCLQLADENCHLANKICYKLTDEVVASACEDIILRQPTEAEELAEKVLSTVQSSHLLNSRGPAANERRMADRFHPQTRYDHLTFNCCLSCTGDLLVV